MSRRMKSHRLAPALCPHCGYLMDAASGIDGKGDPVPGDWSLCLRCGGALLFDADLRPALPPLGAFEALKWESPRVFAKMMRGRELVQQQIKRGDWIPDRGGRT